MAGRKKPAPISMALHKRLPKREAAPVQAFNKDAPEHKEKRIVAKEKRIVAKVVKDKALEARVALLEGATPAEIIVTIPPRPRIESIEIKYDPFGAPIKLLPSYGE